MSDVSGLQSQIVELRAAVSSLARKTAEPATSVVRKVSYSSSTSLEAGPGFTLIDEEVLVDSAGYGGASGAWATLDIASLVSERAKYAYVRFRGVCVQDSEAVTLRVRAEDGAGERTPLEVVPQDSAADTCSDDNAEWVPLSDSRSFDYQPTWAEAPVWSLVLLGYA